MKYAIFTIIAVLLMGCGTSDPAATIEEGNINPPPITDHTLPQGGISVPKYTPPDEEPEEEPDAGDIIVFVPVFVH